MEKEGLARAVEYLKKENVELDTIITDRHRSIAKWILERLPGTNHHFDVWHMAKGACLSIST